MNKNYNFLKKSIEKSPKETEEIIFKSFTNIFSSENIEIGIRLNPPSIPLKEIDNLIKQFNEIEKKQKSKKFYSFQLYTDGIYLSTFANENKQTVNYITDLPISTTLLEILGEHQTGETTSLSCFVVPDFYDPDLSESDMEYCIRHENIEINAKFLFETDEHLKVRLEIINFPSHLQNIYNECSLAFHDFIGESSFPSGTVDTASNSRSPSIHILKNDYFSLEESNLSSAKIVVVGVGGGGGNAVDRMIESGVKGVDFVAINTDLQALYYSKAPVKIQLGSRLMRGLGAGSNPLLGREAALENSKKIADTLVGADMVFITAGMGGGTGTGAAPVIASLARELGILTVGVVTKPFKMEGKKRNHQAAQGLIELKKYVDTIITIPNSRLHATGEKISINDAFRRGNDVLHQAVYGISGLITNPGLINLDFADIRNVMKDRGRALIGFGEAFGEKAAVNAVKCAMRSKCLNEYSIKGASGILMNFNCPSSTPLNDIEEAMSLMTKSSSDEADIFLGTTFNNYENCVQFMFVATGDLARSENCRTKTILKRTRQVRNYNYNHFSLKAIGKMKSHLESNRKCSL